jgi:hypothetical protein
MKPSLRGPELQERSKIHQTPEQLRGSPGPRPGLDSVGVELPLELSLPQMTHLQP